MTRSTLQIHWLQEDHEAKRDPTVDVRRLSRVTEATRLPIWAETVAAPVASLAGSCCDQSKDTPCPACAGREPQKKLAVGRVDDPLEREADRAAEKVLGGGMVGPLSAASQRQRTGQPFDRRDVQITRQPSALPESTAATAGPGRPLSPAERTYFEPRFGQDFSAVRLHGDARAHSAVAAMNARAFTIGNRIFIDRREYSLATVAGRRLLAHELAHVVQQQSTAPVIQRDAREGTSEFEENIPVPPARAGGLYRGDVERRVFAPASGTQPRQEIHSATVSVEFNPTACSVRLPHRYAFVTGEAAAADICAGPPPRTQAVTPVSADRLRQIQTEYLQAVNEGLNNWYQVRLEGDGCESACTGRVSAFTESTRCDGVTFT